MSDLTAVFPPPPWYHEYFTKSNLARAKQHKNDEDKDSFPYKLMVPPQPPAETYRGFGNIWQVQDKLLSLEAAGIKQLYDDKDVEDHAGRIDELKRLLKSLLLNFLELVGMMSINPESFPSKAEDIRIILINMHHLLNEYRPHQSRESLIMLMADQIQAKKQSIASLRQSLAEIKQSLADMATATEIDANAYEIVAQRDRDQAKSDESEAKKSDLAKWEIAKELMT